jgi:hypothetical protein
LRAQAQTLVGDARSIVRYSLPLGVRLIGVAAVAAVPTLVIHLGSGTDDERVAILGSLALAAAASAVVTWAVAVALAGLTVMIRARTGDAREDDRDHHAESRKNPRTESRRIFDVLSESLDRISDSTSHLATLALVAGLVSLAIGLPATSNGKSVLDELLAAQVAVLIAVLGFAFIAEAIRCGAVLLDPEKPSWTVALTFTAVIWVIVTLSPPFKTTRMMGILLRDWDDSGNSEAKAVADLPPDVGWLVPVGGLVVMILVHVFDVRRHDKALRNIKQR